MLYSKELEIEEYDVIVVGGGPSGCAAAIASARHGVKTVLIEAAYTLGGLGTIGGVPAWCPFSDHEKIIYKGIAEEIFDEMKSGMRHISKDSMNWVPIDKELLKRIYDTKVCESGADIVFGTQMVDAFRNGRNIEYIVVSNKNGLTAYKGKVFIDCTGDADIFHRTNLPYEFGDGEGETMPATQCFVLSNVDEYHYGTDSVQHMSNKGSACYKIANSNKYPKVKSAHFCHAHVGPGTVGFNAGHIWDVNSTNPKSFTKGIIEGRKVAYEIHEGLKEFLPKTYAASFLVDTASMVGVRESRRIVGEYSLTKEDYLNRRSFVDEVGRNSYFLDVHFSKDEATRTINGEVVENRDYRYGTGESHGIPYRCLIPRDVDNLYTAGRTISSDRDVNGSVRVMPVCLVTGQAAGTAATLALKTRDSHKIDIDELRSILKKDGVYFL
ncbi:MAG: FAD-dependent oxidoreductase [Lachnospirales bacterium]